MTKEEILAKFNELSKICEERKTCYRCPLSTFKVIERTADYCLIHSWRNPNHTPYRNYEMMERHMIRYSKLKKQRKELND